MGVGASIFRMTGGYTIPYFGENQEDSTSRNSVFEKNWAKR